MDIRPLDFFYDACGLPIPSGNRPEVSGICTDSRKVRSGDLFIAIQGPHFDGHDYVDEALSGGAVAAVVRSGFRLSGTSDPKKILLHTPDTRIALGLIAGAYRRQFSIPIFAVAGSNGKTTTKDLTASVISQDRVVVFSPESFNNDIGVPLTLLSINSTHQAALVEVGTNHPGEMDYLLEMVQPDHGILTGIGREHLEFFGDIDGVLQEESTIAKYIANDGILFANGDSYGIQTIAAQCDGILQTVGFSDINPFKITQCRIHTSQTDFTIEAEDFPELNGDYQVPLPGRVQAINATLSIAVGGFLGLDKGTITQGLLSCSLPKWRMATREISGIRILEDYYNANAESMEAALSTLREIGVGKQKIAVLGEMAELGNNGVEIHREVGEMAARSEVDYLFAIGEHAACMVEGAMGQGLENAWSFESIEDLMKAFRKKVGADDIVLVKGSRAARMERFIDLLLDFHSREVGLP